MAKKVSIINMKGGVGKTTLTVNLAWDFAINKNTNTLVVDLDPQFNSSQYLLGIPQYQKIISEGKPTIWDVFEQNTHTPSGKGTLTDYHSPIYEVCNYPFGGRLDLIPSRLELAFSLKNPAQKERQLHKVISKIENEYDLILIDCAPTESLLTTAAYLASDYLLVPVKPEFLSTIGLPLLVNSMEDFQQEHDDHDLKLAGIVFNATTDYSPEEMRSKDEVRSIASKHGWYVFNTEIPFSRSFPKGAREGRPISNTSYARMDKIQQFEDFMKEFAERIGL